MRDIFKSGYMPILLGCGKTSNAVSFRLFLKFGMRSLVIDNKRTLSCFLSPFSSFIKTSDSNKFMLLSLKRLAQEYSDMTLIVIPCTEKYENFIRKNSEIIESDYIILSSEKAFNICSNAKLEM